jgi:EH domain-containing protein 1
VYIGSFNSEAPIDAAKNPQCVELFEKEQAQLLHDLYEIPSRSCDRKVSQKSLLLLSWFRLCLFCLALST